MSARDVIVAVDVSGTHVRMGMVNGAGRLIASESRASALIDDPGEGPARLAALLERQIAEWGGSHRLTALALGFPSTVSRHLHHVRRPLPFEGLSIHFSPGDEYGVILGGAMLAARMLHREGDES